MLTGILIIFLGCYVIIHSFKSGRKLSKYEFENRTGDGVVEFRNYDSSREHHNKKILNLLGIAFGPIMIFLGLTSIQNNHSLLGVSPFLAFVLLGLSIYLIIKKIKQ